MNRKFLYIFVFFTFLPRLQAQKDTIAIQKDSSYSFFKTSDSYDPLRPARAAFYSAVIPGMGQAYNKRYWKVPIVYGALAASLYYYSTNRNQFKRFRKAFNLRAAGQQDEFVDTFSTEGLENAQTILRKNRDTSLLTFIGLYALQVLEASIDAHLTQFNTSDDISFSPTMLYNENNNEHIVGLSLNINF